MKIFSSWLFWFMLAHWILLLGFLIFSLKHLFKPFKDIKRIYWILLLLIFLAGFYLNNSQYWFNQHTDGYVSEESAHYWLKTGKFVKTCALGNVDDCKLYQQVLFLPGHPFLIVLSDLIFGYKSIHGPMVSAILSSFTVIVLFLLLYLLFKNEIFGLLASLIFIFIPFWVRESHSPMPRPVSLLFISLTLLFFLTAVKEKKWRLWILTALTLSFAIYVRQENYILLPFLGFFFLIFNWPKIWVALKENLSVFLICFALFFLLQIPALRWLIFNNPINSYPTNQGPFGIFWGNIPILAPAILKQFFNQSFARPLNHYNIYISTFFLVGLFLSLALAIFRKENRKENLFLSGFFLLYFLFSAMVAPAREIYAGQLRSGDYLRRTLHLNLGYAMLAAYPFYLLIGLIGRFSPLAKKFSAGFILISLMIFLALTFPFPFGFSLFKDVRAEKPYPDYYLAVAKTPNDCYLAGTNFMIYTSDYFPNNRRRLVDLELIMKSTHDLFLAEMKKADCLIYFEDWRCQRCNPLFDSCYPCEFLEKYFDKELLFRQNEINAFKLIPKL